MMEEEGEVDGGHQRLQQQRRSLASILSIGSGTSKTVGGTASKIRPKTPSVVITDESTVLSELSGIPAGRGSRCSRPGGGPPASVNGATLEGIVALETCSDTEAAGTMQQQQTSVVEVHPTPRPSLVRRCCHERVRKSIWGLLIMTSVSAAWVGATHLLKSTFRPVHFPVQHPSPLLSTTTTTSNPVASAAALRSATTTTPPTHDDDSDDNIHLFNQSFISTSSDEELYTYDASFFNTWTVTTWTVLFLPLYAIGCLLSGRMGFRKLGSDIRESVLAFRDKGFTLGTFVGRCCLFCLLWVGTNWMYMYALSVLDATDVMALFATNVTFVYLLSWVVLHDQFVGLRIVAVILCNTGIALLAYMDGITRSPTLGGVVLAAAASAGSAVYKVSFKRIFGEATYGQVSFFFTLIGLLNLALFWPLLLTLHFTGLEVLIWSRVPWTQLALAGCLSLVANLLGNFGPAVTYEVYIHLGLVAAIPVSAVLDTTYNGVIFEGMKLAGTVMIVSGFLLVLLPENWTEYLTRFLRWGRHLNQHNTVPQAAPVDLRTGYISRSHLRSPSGRVR